MATTEPRKLQWKKEEIITSFTDEEAAEIVESKVTSEFAKSIISKFKAQPLSDNQLFWLHKLALQTEKTSQQVEVSGVFQAVRAMMKKASTKLQQPRIRILGEDQQEIKLYPASSNSKYPGSIQVYSNEWLGSIDKTGFFHPCRACPNWVIPALEKLADNPHQAAQEYGILTGRCCFCYQRLSTDTSLSLGYGPVCARNYGLLK